MNTYRFETTTTMKPYNRDNWWIDATIVRPVEVHAASVTEALSLWRNIVRDRDYVTVSSNALKTKQPMYRDFKDGRTEQIGYVITGKTDFDRGNYAGYCSQYIDLWVSISIVTTPDFYEE